MKSTRNTSAKLAIKNMINSAESALSHTDIQNQIGDLCNRVTIYRILNRLVEEGEAHKIVDADGIIKYANCSDCVIKHNHTHSHVHFSCVSCHKVTCLEHVIPTFDLPKNYMVEETNFTLTGTCPACA